MDIYTKTRWSVNFYNNCYVYGQIGQVDVADPEDYEDELDIQLPPQVVLVSRCDVGGHHRLGVREEARAPRLHARHHSELLGVCGLCIQDLWSVLVLYTAIQQDKDLEHCSRKPPDS